MACILYAGILHAQTRVTGKVTSSEDGLPIPGVAVTVVGTTIGTTTDIDGVYVISIPENKSSIQFSFVGMSTRIIDIDRSDEGSVDIVLAPDLMKLDEVVVVGYTSKGKNQITGSTIQVTGDDLKDIPVLSVDQTLQGKVAGLTISTSSGSPGAVQDIRIRGVGSLSAGNDPLIVIDGSPVVNTNFSGDNNGSSLSSLSALNSADIETITVLKDASATSAYGARGSNGVIVITTKKGKSGITSFNLNSSYGFQNRASNGEDVLTGAQREELYIDGVYNSYGADEGFTREEAFDWALASGFSGAAKYQAWRDAGRPEGNWDDALTNENAALMNLNLSASGGDENSTFYTSLGYNKTESVVVGSEFRRINGAMNYERKFGERVRFSTNNMVSNSFQDGVILEQGAFFANPHLGKYFMPPISQPFDAEGNPNTNLNTSIYSWLYLAENDILFNDMTRGLSNSFLEWKILDNLKYKTFVGFDYTIVHYKEYKNRNYGDSAPENGTSFASLERNINMVTQNSLSYDITLMDDHRISLMALMEYQQNKRHMLWGYGENYSTDGLTNIDQSGAYWEAGSSFEDWLNLSYLGMINYNFQGRYIMDITYRREGSSRFSPENRYGNFWSTGVAWNITQESFMDNMVWIDNLRLRASYGISGNSEIGINQYQALLGYDRAYASQGAIYASEYGNSSLTWEKNKTFDIGADFAFLNRIDGSVSYFNKFTYDLLQAVPLSRTSGHNTITQNVGAVLNKGIESIINVQVIKMKEFNLNLSANFATLNNEVTELAKDGEGNDINIQTGTTKIAVGHPLREWYMRKWAGVNPDNGMPLWYLNGTDGEVTEDYYEADEAFQGTSAIPKYTGGGSLHMEFKGIYLDASFYFAGGHSIFENWSFYTYHSGRYTSDTYTGVAKLMDRWQEPGDITNIPKQIHDNTGFNASRTSTRFLYEGDYARMKDLVIGYNIPTSLTTRIGIKRMNVYFRGTNLLTWVKDKELQYDPEVRANGLTQLTTPPVKSVIFGLNLNF